MQSAATSELAHGAYSNRHASTSDDPHIGYDRKIWSRAGGHEGGEDVVGMSVEVFAGSVVAHGGSRVGVADGDLYVAQVNTGVQHRGDEDVPEHVRVHPRQLDTCCSARRRS